MAMWIMKGWPRCGGDMFIDRDLYGWYEKRLQCGYCCELRGLDEFGQSSARKDERLVGMPGHETG
jgi:hypothetical protein